MEKMKLEEYLKLYPNVIEEYDLRMGEEESIIAASKLFGIPADELNFLGYNDLFGYSKVKKAAFSHKNKEIAFFVKEAWEGALNEAIGIELSNLITDTPIRFMLDPKFIIIEDAGRMVNQEIKKVMTAEDFAFQVGMLQEFTNVLQLADRKVNNIVIKDGRLKNIDFGFVLYNAEDLPYRKLYEDWDSYKRGVLNAREIILSNISNNWGKIAKLSSFVVIPEVWEDISQQRHIVIRYTPEEAIREYLLCIGKDLDGITDKKQ